MLFYIRMEGIATNYDVEILITSTFPHITGKTAAIQQVFFSQFQLHNSHRLYVIVLSKNRKTAI